MVTVGDSLVRSNSTLSTNNMAGSENAVVFSPARTPVSASQAVDLLEKVMTQHDATPSTRRCDTVLSDTLV